MNKHLDKAMRCSGALLLIFVVGISLGQKHLTPSLNKGMECSPPKLPMYLDSAYALRKVALDSISNKMTGHWELVGMRNGWSKPYNSSSKIEMILGKHGKAVVYENDVPITDCAFDLTTRFGYIRVLIEEKGKPFFEFSPKRRGLLIVCDQVLVIDQNVGDGMTYTFTRLK